MPDELVDFPIFAAIIAARDEYMEMICFGTSALVKKYVEEKGNEKIDSPHVEG